MFARVGATPREPGAVLVPAGLPPPTRTVALQLHFRGSMEVLGGARRLRPAGRPGSAGGGAEAGPSPQVPGSWTRSAWAVGGPAAACPPGAMEKPAKKSKKGTGERGRARPWDQAFPASPLRNGDVARSPGRLSGCSPER